MLAPKGQVFSYTSTLLVQHLCIRISVNNCKGDETLSNCSKQKGEATSGRG